MTTEWKFVTDGLRIGKLPEVLDEKLPIVEELNQEHFVTRIGGKTIVVNEVHDTAMDRNILTYSAPTDLKKLLFKQVHHGK